MNNQILSMFLIIELGQSPPFYIYYVTVFLCFHKYPPLPNDIAFFSPCPHSMTNMGRSLVYETTGTNHSNSASGETLAA